MRNPNGYGSVFRLSGNRRKPFVARLTKGWSEKGFPVYQVIGYYEKRSEALQALADYHREPWNTDKTTVDEIIEKALDRIRIAEGTKKQYLFVYRRHIAPFLGSVKVSDLRLALVQNVMDQCVKCKGICRSIAKAIERYALEYEYISKPFAEFLVISAREPQHIKTTLTQEELKSIHQDESMEAEVIRIYLYTGLRMRELLNLRYDDVKRDGDILYFQTGSKTKAGKNRIIPIHPKILPFILSLLKGGGNGTYLLPPDLRMKFLYSTTAKRTLKKFFPKSDHTLHELRHTFRTELDRVNANSVCIDRLMGHASESIGSRIYTHKTIQELYDTLQLLKFI